MKPAMKLNAALILLCAATAASADPFPKGNAMAGQELFTKHDCNRCHNSIMKGDGNNIFTRIDRKVKTPDDLINQIGMCRDGIGVQLTAQQMQDLAAYLNRYYKLK
ncbi:MAG: c-type cytochrome [Gallionella sp.]|nr:c-type cytochrome [Gallionella sp.]